MSNFICSECGMTNIDCGGAGYKTPKEIELEKKLDIATKALREYADEIWWGDCKMSADDYEYVHEKCAWRIKGYKTAQKALLTFRLLYVIILYIISKLCLFAKRISWRKSNHEKNIVSEGSMLLPFCYNDRWAHRSYCFCCRAPRH
jgi:hypothetical protein